MIREDAGAPSEGATRVWMAADEAVGCMMRALAMWRCSQRLVCRGRPEPGFRVNYILWIQWRTRYDQLPFEVAPSSTTPGITAVCLCETKATTDHGSWHLETQRRWSSAIKARRMENETSGMFQEYTHVWANFTAKPNFI
ncbi:hypothetical protein TNCV_4431611 [Trichonephila clavipes]|nr:hypothetical protein TNCV_4431611 [Trichonephila clavipes]